MFFKLFEEMFLGDSKILQFTIGDHLQMLFIWVVAIICLHVTLVCVKNVVKVCAKPTWTIFLEIGKGLGSVYFCVVALIGGIYYFVVMTPLLLVSTIVVGGFIPLCSGMYILGVKCGDLMDNVMVYTGIIPGMFWRLYVWVCDQDSTIQANGKSQARMVGQV